MSRLFFAVPYRLKLVLLALALVPCAPGATFLLAGWARDTRQPAPTLPPFVHAESLRASEQARALYRAGSVALGVGVMCGLGVVWAVMRQRAEQEEVANG